ncbi:conserved hypothetical protein [Capnocytophaga canimorsus]|uniref:DUF4835 domain-containing protein n=1 Tax=Capnocytophaga canimorsus TaxID=28188 RepID=A0A0B7H5B7_9FLAO|nr:conserved hypothetical protein [Capnocytophaga canimorsus]
MSCFLGQLHSQELNCTFSVDARQINITDKRVFKTLEKSVQDFINQTSWSNIKNTSKERIQCNMTLVLTKFEGNQFEGNLLVQAMRPVYNAVYQSPVLNLQDKQVAFTYQEHEPLSFNNNTFSSNLTSVLAFYAYVILGFLIGILFAPSAGASDVFTSPISTYQMLKVVGLAGGQMMAPTTVWRLLDELLSESYSQFHQVLYQYHRFGMDLMSSDTKKAKEEIQKALISLSEIANVRLNSYTTNLFFDAKADEIKAIFAAGALINTQVLKEKLQKMAPLHTSKWNEIK